MWKVVGQVWRTIPPIEWSHKCRRGVSAGPIHLQKFMQGPACRLKIDLSSGHTDCRRPYVCNSYWVSPGTQQSGIFGTSSAGMFGLDITNSSKPTLERSFVRLAK